MRGVRTFFPPLHSKFADALVLVPVPTNFNAFIAGLKVKPSFSNSTHMLPRSACNEEADRDNSDDAPVILANDNKKISLELEPTQASCKKHFISSKTKRREKCEADREKRH